MNKEKNMFKNLWLVLFSSLGLSAPLLGDLPSNNTDPHPVEIPSVFRNAQTWYNDMAEKYPSEKLQNIAFKSDSYAASHYAWSGQDGTQKIIAFPTLCTGLLSICYKNPILEYFKPSFYKDFLNTNEWILLHEAHHINHNHGIKHMLLCSAFAGAATTAAAVIISASVRLCINRCKTKNTQTLANSTSKTPEKTDINNTSQSTADKMRSYIALGAEYVAVIALALTITREAHKYVSPATSRILESYADNNANKKGSKEALEGGIKFFEGLITLQNIAKSTNIFSVDFGQTHPTPQSRLKAIQDAYQRRFGPAQHSC